MELPVFWLAATLPTHSAVIVVSSPVRDWGLATPTELMAMQVTLHGWAAVGWVWISRCRRVPRSGCVFGPNMARSATQGL